MIVRLHHVCFAIAIWSWSYKSVSPLASFFLLLRQKKETKEKATPDRSKARNKINGLRRLRKLAVRYRRTAQTVRRLKTSNHRF
jgi:hypothetical protein